MRRRTDSDSEKGLWNDLDFDLPRYSCRISDTHWGQVSALYIIFSSWSLLNEWWTKTRYEGEGGVKEKVGLCLAWDIPLYQH
jgi:hypothetical protein